MVITSNREDISLNIININYKIFKLSILLLLLQLFFNPDNEDNN